MKNQKPKVLAVVGPTASGKTSLAIELAKEYDGEIISADSMQIYKGMNIATAKPFPEEKQGVRHYLMDFLEPEQEFSVSDFILLANQAIEEILSKNKLPILCGGTGLYIRSLIENIQLLPQSRDDAFRAELEKRYAQEGGEALLKELAVFDPEIAKTLHPSARKRILRAIEIYHASGMTMTEQIQLSKSKPSPYDWTVIGLCFADRQKLYDRIDFRVDIMMASGLLEEAKEFYSQYHGKTAAAAIGYKELLPYLQGESSLEDCIEVLKRETRRYAKRQMTWFRKDAYISWIEADKEQNLLEAAKKIIEK